MKRFATYGLALTLILSGCTRRRAASPLPTPKAYGTQIVEVSGGKQIGGVGSKLPDPLVVQVNGADGNPVAGALVSFRGAGLMFNPPYASSDASGQVSVVVQLGGIPGSYQVLAETPKSGGGTVTVTSREIALGYQEKLGKEVSEKYCAVCHDPESTPEKVSNFDNLAPPAPHQFTDGNTLNPMSDGDLIKIIADGGPALGKSPQTPAYRRTLTMAEIKAVVAYLRAVADPPYLGATGK
ncbi:MAG: c-type cytochrome [Terriglobales bacterium]